MSKHQKSSSKRRLVVIWDEFAAPGYSKFYNQSAASIKAGKTMAEAEYKSVGTSPCRIPDTE